MVTPLGGSAAEDLNMAMNRYLLVSARLAVVGFVLGLLAVAGSPTRAVAVGDGISESCSAGMLYLTNHAGSDAYASLGGQDYLVSDPHTILFPGSTSFPVYAEEGFQIGTADWKECRSFLALGSPVRLVDSRAGQLGVLELPGGSIGSDRTAALVADTPVRFVVTNTSGIPATVGGLALNITAVKPVVGGFIKVYPCASTATTAPATSTVNFQANVTQANGAIAAVDASGGLCVVSSQTTHVILDASGYFSIEAFDVATLPLCLTSSTTSDFYLTALGSPAAGVGVVEYGCSSPAPSDLLFVVAHTSAEAQAMCSVVPNREVIGRATDHWSSLSFSPDVPTMIWLCDIISS